MLIEKGVLSIKITFSNLFHNILNSFKNNIKDFNILFI